MTQQTPIASASRAAGAPPDEGHPYRAVSCVLRLPALPSAAGLTRRHVRRLLRAWRLAAVTDVAQLMASELVANAATAARAVEDPAFPDGPRRPPKPIELGLRRTEVSLIIEVRDPNPEPPVLQQADPEDEGGRGLLIIEILSVGWGYHAAEGGGKVVWCEISLAGECPAGMLALSAA